MNLLEQDTRPQTSYRFIALTLGQFTIVDAVHIGHLSQWKWSALKTRRGSFYAVRGYILDGKQHFVYMHREILGLKEGDPRQGDHRNGYTLDNRDNNLRIATPVQNTQNSKSHKKNSLKGIWLDRRGRAKPWCASIRSCGRKIFLGSFSTPEEAHAAYCNAATRLHGEFARHS